MKFIYIFLLIGLIASCTNNNYNDPIKKIREIKATDSSLLSRILVDSTSKQFGIKNTLTDTVIEFKLTNVSTIDYKINYIIPSCDCLTASYSKSKISPKEIINIYVKFSPRKLNGYKGTVRKFVAVIGNSYPVSQNLFINGVLK